MNFFVCCIDLHFVFILIINSIAKRDFPVVCGTLLLISAAILIINLLVDILYAFIDPRVRFGKK